MKRTLSIVGGCFVLALLVGVIADCSAGHTRHIESLVMGHRFVPGYLSTWTNVDADGNVTTDSTWHPEEYHLDCAPCGIDYSWDHSLDVRVSQEQFESVTNGQYVTVRVREGKWTGARYLPQLAD